MDLDSLAILCCERLDVELRQLMLRRVSEGRDPLELLPPWRGSLGQVLRHDLDPRGEGRRRLADLSRRLAAGELALLRPGMPAYPPPLAALTRPPDPLFLQGSPDLLVEDGVAMVGTRRPDEEGLAWARRMGRELALLGFVVISGGAAGIDAAAHRAAGSRRTVAVLGTGFDHPYPAGHRDLFGEIARDGLLISEWPPWTRPETWRFPRRNRVIAGLSRAVVVVQAPLRSGALSTAHHAVEEGREVLVCPGPAGHPLYAGSHRLIREGARLVATAEDLLEDLAGLPLTNPHAPLRRLDAAFPATDGREPPDAAAEADPELWEALATPLSRDGLAAALGQEPAALATRLLVGELEGRLRSLPGDRWSRHTWQGD